MSLKLNDILVFTDGAASGNPGPAGWGVLILFPDGQLEELGGGSQRATNNQMELTAAIEGLRAVEASSGPVTLATDSKYVISGATEWISGWKRRGWKTFQNGEVLNRDLWEEIDELISLPRFRGQLKWTYVPGHSGVPGNERTDQIAVGFSKGPKPSLFRGNIASYSVSELEIRDLAAQTAAPNKRSKLPALHYLSLIGGELRRHPTWAECEARVKGKAGAKFKKVTSLQEEKQILNHWGVSSSDD